MDIDVDLIRRDLAQLVSYDSIGGSQSEAAVQRWSAATLQGLGLEVDLWPLDLEALRADPEYPGEEVEREEAWGCVGTWRPDPADDRPPRLILNGHLDVVPPGDPEWWTGHDPWYLHEDDDTWYGRGVCDMKGGVAAILAAVRAVGEQLTRPFAVHTVIGEEDGGLGTFATLQRGHTGEVCLIAEPTDGNIVAANAGALTFRLEIRGRATHGSMAGRGLSALDLFERVNAELHALDVRRNVDPPAPFGSRPWPISIGIVHAGDWASTVPDLLVAEGRFGVRPGESFDEATGLFEHTLAAIDEPWLREHPVQVTWPGGRFAAGSLPDGHGFGQQVADAVAAVGAKRPDLVGAPYGSDLRQYAAHGIATLQFGPGRIEQAHAVDEFVPIEEVVRSAQTYARLLLELCG
ncbi:ArgE/DapE family deacylase [Aeromicrobium sp. CTD01-1L150]|uniref:ArgE/DapE family deacylase n=1 Tax=Aeromicrobium sp. CTD01-1L150 TaxID=3341830 RepID=UPI0035BFABA5